MSLKELVNHVQGLSEQGSGKRSFRVMKEMGWFDEHNQLSDDMRTQLGF